jgi:hypothetical protein
MRPPYVLDVDIVITSAIPVICKHWRERRDVVALPSEETLEAMNETFQVAILSLMLTFMVLSPFTELLVKNTPRCKLLSVEFQASKLQGPDSCAKSHEIESCRRCRCQCLNSAENKLSECAQGWEEFGYPLR